MRRQGSIILRDAPQPVPNKDEEEIQLIVSSLDEEFKKAFDRYTIDYKEMSKVQFCRFCKTQQVIGGNGGPITLAVVQFEFDRVCRALKVRKLDLNGFIQATLRLAKKSGSSSSTNPTTTTTTTSSSFPSTTSVSSPRTPLRARSRSAASSLSSPRHTTNSLSYFLPIQNAKVDSFTHSASSSSSLSPRPSTNRVERVRLLLDEWLTLTEAPAEQDVDVVELLRDDDAPFSPHLIRAHSISSDLLTQHSGRNSPVGLQRLEPTDPIEKLFRFYRYELLKIFNHFSEKNAKQAIASDPRMSEERFLEFLKSSHLIGPGLSFGAAKKIFNGSTHIPTQPQDTDSFYSGRSSPSLHPKPAATTTRAKVSGLTFRQFLDALAPISSILYKDVEPTLLYQLAHLLEEIFVFMQQQHVLTDIPQVNLSSIQVM